MDPARSHHGEPPESVEWLFDRLSEVPDITWTRDFEPVHSTYDDFNVWGTQRIVSSPESKDNPSSPRHDSTSTPIGPRPSLGTRSSSSSATTPGTTEPTQRKVLARVSRNQIRLERQYQVVKSLLPLDPSGEHHVRALQLLRLPAREGKNEGTLAVLLLEYPGSINSLRRFTNYGPNWYLVNQGPALHNYDPKVASDGHSPSGQISLTNFLRFAIGATDCCHLFHQQSLIHGEIRPDAIHFDDSTGRVRWVNYGAGVRSFENGLTSQGWSALSSEHGIEHRLQFIAPEQTGRLPATPDSRTDLYSLGILFWSVLAGDVPFQGNTAIEVMQNVLSRRVPPISTKRNDVANALCRVLQKMVERNVEHRYHSALGLKWDLEQIQKLLTECDTEQLKNFEVCTQDMNCVFRISNAQFGREQEKEAIIAVIERVAKKQQRGWSAIANRQDQSATDHSMHRGHVVQTSSQGFDISDGASLRSKSSSTSNNALDDIVNSRENPHSPVRHVADEQMDASVNGDASSIGSVLGKTLSSETNADGTSSDAFSRHFASLNSKSNPKMALKAAQRFNREGKTEVVTICGSAGLGKSSIIQSIQPSVRSRGYWASAKFDNMRKTPFEPMRQVMSSLFRQIFMEADENSTFHADLKAFVRPVWPILHQMLGIPQTLLESSGKTQFSSLSTSGSIPGFDSGGNVQPSTPSNTSGYVTSPKGPTYSHGSFRDGKGNDFIKPGTASKNSRFLAIFLDVLRFLALRRLIVFCLDDVQLADEESLELLLSIIKAKVSIVVILTYRDESALSSLAQAIIKSDAPKVTNIVLSPLKKQDIADLVAGTLQRTYDYISPLVAVTLEKTGGYPFFVREFLESCYKKACIWYSWTDHLWKFDLDKVFQKFGSAADGSQIVNEFILNRLAELPPSSRILLSWASLLGNTFRFSLVKHLMQNQTNSPTEADKHYASHRRYDLVRQSSQDAVKGLEAALGAWIIVPTDQDDTFQFCHNRYLQAVWSLAECNSVNDMHFQIALVLTSKYGDDEDQYSKSAHICASVELLKARVKDRRPYRDALSNAAAQSVESGGKSTGLEYLSSALALLQDDSWNESLPDVDYNETLDLYVRTAECHWRQDDGDAALKLLDKAFTNVKAAVDGTSCCILMSRIHAKKGNHQASFEILKDALGKLDLPVAAASMEDCEQRFRKLQGELEEIVPHELEQREPSADPKLHAITELLAEITTAAFWTDPLTYLQICLDHIDVTLHRGITPQAAVAFVHFGAISLSGFDLVTLGCKLGRLANSFFEIFERDSYTLGRGLGLNCLLIGWCEQHFENLVSAADTALEQSLAAGDRNFAILNACFAAQLRLWASHDAAEVEAYCSYGPEELTDWQNDDRGGLVLTAVRQFCRAVQGKTSRKNALTLLCDSRHDTRSYLDWATAGTTNPDRAEASYRSLTLPVFYLYGYYEEAVERAESILKVVGRTYSTRVLASVGFYLSLSYMALIREGYEMSKEEERFAFVKAQHSWFIRLGEVNDINIAAWIHILGAIIYEYEAKMPECVRSFEAALDHSEVHGFVYEQGLAAELYAEFLIRRGANRLARNTLKDSMAAYRKISYFGKAKHVADQHEWLLTGTSSLHSVDAACQTERPAEEDNVETEPSLEQKNADSATMTALLHSTHDQHYGTANSNTALPSLEAFGLDMIDVTGILQSSQVLSSELQIDRLLSKMVKIIMESTGAELAAIVVKDENIGWNVAAISDSFGTEFPNGEPLDSVEDVVGKKITLYCLRFQETVSVQNVYHDERFADAPESYRKRNPDGKAVIATPILQRNNVLGCVYVEGPPRSFTQRNVAVLNMLISSVGISITNANLFKQVERVSASNEVMIESQKQALQQARTAEKKAKQSQLEALENLRQKEEAAKAKSMFLANTSHELRTPLNGVIGSSSLLKNSELTAEQEEWVESIHVCADTLLQVINDILDYSKLEAGKMQMFSVPLNLSETIAEAVRALSYGNMGKDVETVMNLAFPNDLIVNGDPVRLHQILMNLLSNSYKFTTKGSVTVKAVVEYEDEKDIQVTCSVSDTGIGIDDTQKQKLFMPFSQADSTTSRSYGGTGLGLSICKAIIENAMGGTIWLESQLGVGTTVYFTLNFTKVPKSSVVVREPRNSKGPDPMAVFSPQDSKEGNSTHPLDLISIPRDEIRICIAEDNPINQKIAISYVRKLGFECEAFADGAQTLEALEKAASNGKPFSFVLMDCQMPVLDGYDATRQIRQNAKRAINDVVIIAMTASAIRGDREKCLEAGMNNYLAKPVRQESLKQMIESYLQQGLSADGDPTETSKKE